MSDPQPMHVRQSFTNLEHTVDNLTLTEPALVPLKILHKAATRAVLAEHVAELILAFAREQAIR